MNDVNIFLNQQAKFNCPKEYSGNYQWNHPDFYGQFLQDGTFTQISIIDGHKKDGFWWIQKQNQLHFRLMGYWYKIAKMNSLEQGDLHLVGTGDFGKIKKINRNYWGQSKYQGQMYPKQRIALYEEVKKKNPKICLQVGTWKGGGSTLIFGRVLKQLNCSGILYTCEPDTNFYNQAVKAVKESGYEQQVKLFNCKSEELIQKMISESLIPDFIFFDGPDIPEVALNDIKKLQPKLKQQTIFSMHDWIEDGGKCKLIKPYLSNSTNWNIIRIQQAPNSVGLIFFKYKIIL